MKIVLVCYECQRNIKIHINIRNHMSGGKHDRVCGYYRNCKALHLTNQN